MTLFWPQHLHNHSSVFRIQRQLWLC
jgi:hypothetical protein